MQPSFYRNAAKTAWLSPVVAIALGYCASAGIKASGTTGPLVQLVLTLVTGIFVLIGFFSAVIALLGMKSQGRQGILVPAAVGLAINGLLILAAVEVLSAARKVAAASEVHPQQQLAAAEQDGRDSVLKYAGWVGALRTESGILTIGTLDDNSPTARMISDDLGTPCSLVMVATETGVGSAPPRIDPSSLKLSFNDGRFVEALDAHEVLGASHGAAAGAIARLQAPGKPQGDRVVSITLCFIPRGLSFRNVSSVTLTVNGKTTRVPGRLLSAGEKSNAYNEAPKASGAPANPRY